MELFRFLKQIELVICELAHLFLIFAFDLLVGHWLDADFLCVYVFVVLLGDLVVWAWSGARDSNVRLLMSTLGDCRDMSPTENEYDS